MTGKASLIVLTVVGCLFFVHPNNGFVMASEGKWQFSSTVDTGIGTVDEDGFLWIMMQQEIIWRSVFVHLSGPLRFRIIDRHPDDIGRLRRQDWDEPSDYFRILRSILITHNNESFRLDSNFGELNDVSIGHGTLVDSYYNSTDMDHYQPGLSLRLDWQGNGVECLVENVISPDLVIGRIYLTPFSWFFEHEVARLFEVGLTTGFDIAAPYRIQDRQPSAIPIVSLDISYTIVDSANTALRPYAAVAAMDGDFGFHGGAFWLWRISRKKGIELSLKVEYRHSGSDYHPAVINPFYDYNRLQFPANSVIHEQVPTFADFLAEPDVETEESGVQFNMEFNWRRLIWVKLLYDRIGKNRPHWVLGRVECNLAKEFKLAVFYAGQDINGGGDFIGLDALMGIGIRGKLVGPINMFAEFTRRWRGVDDTIAIADETVAGLGITAYF